MNPFDEFKPGSYVIINPQPPGNYPLKDLLNNEFTPDKVYQIIRCDLNYYCIQILPEPYDILWNYNRFILVPKELTNIKDTAIILQAVNLLQI